MKGYEYYAKGQYVVVTDEDFEKRPAVLSRAEREGGRQGLRSASRRLEGHRPDPSPERSCCASASTWQPWSQQVMVLSMMRFAREIRSPNDLELPKAGEGWNKKEMDLGHRLIDTLADKWKPEEFRDAYTQKELELPRQERRPPVANMMKALEQSLARKEPAKAAALALRLRIIFPSSPRKKLFSQQSTLSPARRACSDVRARCTSNALVGRSL